MSNHYVFLRPGEKIFILTDDVAGDSDYTHVIEAEIPVHLNDCANLTSGDYPGSTVLEAYARVNERRLGNNPDHAFVAKPLGKWNGTTIEAEKSGE